MTRLLVLSLILLSISTVHCGLFDGIRNCRRIRCYFKVGSLTMRSWSTEVCGHSCGTVHQRVPERCLRTYYGRSPSYEEMCTADTFEHGTPQGACTLNRFLWGQQSMVTIYRIRHLPGYPFSVGACFRNLHMTESARCSACEKI